MYVQYKRIRFPVVSDEKIGQMLSVIVMQIIDIIDESERRWVFSQVTLAFG